MKGLNLGKYIFVPTVRKVIEERLIQKSDDMKHYPLQKNYSRMFSFSSTDGKDKKEALKLLLKKWGLGEEEEDDVVDEEDGDERIRTKLRESLLGMARYTTYFDSAILLTEDDIVQSNEQFVEQKKFLKLDQMNQNFRSLLRNLEIDEWSWFR